MKRRNRPGVAFPSSSEERLMIVQQSGALAEARVIGSLTGEGIQILLDAVDGGVAVLDLSEVDRVDDSAVRALAGVRPERCKLRNCPRWLELWLACVREREADAAADGGLSVTARPTQKPVTEDTR